MIINKSREFGIDFVVGFVLSVAAGALASLALIILVLMLPANAQAAPVSQGLISKSEVTRGSVLLRTDQPGRYTPAPILNTDVHMRVNGMLVRTKVVQRFKNPGQDWVEGIYVFPLPENAAVDHLRMRIGERIIEGKIKEKQEAKKIYQQAKRQGKKAALVEQERPNMFTNSVANIGPGETISVEIEYQQTLRYENEHFRVRFPLVVGPRYIPGRPQSLEEQVSGFGGHGWANNTDQVADASRITPPVQHPVKGKINPVTMHIELNAGFPMVSVQSTYHKISKQVLSAEKAVITLQGKSVPADRDFELVWQPDKGHVPRAALFKETRNGHDYMMMMVMPPDTQHQQSQVLNREVIYVIDTSGSMGGASIRQAKQALRYAIRQLKPGDYFNLIQFNSYTSKLFEYSVPADQVNIHQALNYVDALNANGGTEMASALHAALDRPNETGLVRQVVFLTDGSIGNEDALFGIIKRKLGNSRLFTVGIGSAPNSHFMNKAASFGRGSYTYIGKLQEVNEKMSSLFRKIESPLLSDIKIHWPAGMQVEMWPKRLPDLYAGEPLVFTAKAKSLTGKISLTGKRLQQEWKVSLPLQSTQSANGVGVLWARAKIASLMDSLHEGVGQDVVKKAVVDVALEHHLVSKYTSLVAVDVTPSRPLAEALKQKALKTNLPAGWQHNKVFGTMPQTAAGSLWDMLLGLLLIVLGCLISIYFQERSRHEHQA